MIAVRAMNGCNDESHEGNTFGYVCQTTVSAPSAIATKCSSASGGAQFNCDSLLLEDKAPILNHDGFQ